MQAHADPADHLNQGCFCTTLNRHQLHQLLQSDVLNQDLLTGQTPLFSNTSVFISRQHAEQIYLIIDVVTRLTKYPPYIDRVLAQAPQMVLKEMGPEGVFMGYDFHLSEHGPQMIEINTNAGGAFLNAALLSAQTECCRAAGFCLPSKPNLNAEFIEMFVREWALQRGNVPLKSIAIVDESPAEQFLYPEFKMAQRLFEQQGFSAVIADVRELAWVNGALQYQGQTIDLVYNRLTDFSLEKAESHALRQAYEKGAVVMTPNPRHHALYADKRNFTILSNQDALIELGVNAEDIAILQAGFPATCRVTQANAEELWLARKQLFFKPAVGFGSRAAYRGDKLTKRVWSEILQNDYVAQKIVPPSERGILVDGKETTLKVDIRAYVYAGKVQLLAARLYQGQTTNFRTQGGGFAPVYVIG
jgi:hypothetical protein